MTQELATRDRQQWLSRRFELAQMARFGRVAEVPQAQRGMLLLIADRYDLDPLTDITLYEGQPFVLIDGWYKIMRRQATYAGHTLRPLAADEREAWGFEPGDLVIECAIRTTDHGTIVDRGTVRAAEIERARKRSAETGKRSAPIGIYVSEIAQKRAVARTARAAFGLEMPEEVSEPPSSAELAARQVEIMGTEESYWLKAPGDDKGSVDPTSERSRRFHEMVTDPEPQPGDDEPPTAILVQEPESEPVDASPEPGDPPVTVYGCSVCDMPLYHPDGTAVTKEEVDAMQKRYGAVLCKKDQKGR